MHIAPTSLPDGTPALLVSPADAFGANLVDDEAYVRALEAAPFWTPNGN